MRYTNTNKMYFLIGAVVIGFFTWLTIIKPLKYSRSSLLKYNIIPRNKIIQTFRECTRKNVQTPVTAAIYFENFENCMHILPFSTFDFFSTAYFEENKIFLPMKPDFDQEKCIWLTVGIGGDDKAERQFKVKYPGCRLFGIEASSDQYAEFGNFGEIIPYGVGMKSGTLSLKVRQKTTYVNKNITVSPFIHLLDTYIGERFIHYMTIDIEGVEFSILRELLPGGKLDSQGVAFCQIDAELHRFPPESQEYVKDFLEQFNAPDSNYLPIYHALFLGKHHKVTFINIQKKECQEAFDLTSYLK